MKRLAQKEIEEKLVDNSQWNVTNEKWIMRIYRFRNYLQGIEFVSEIAAASEKADHHPFISIDYKRITVKLSSWHAKGLTALDFIMAEKYDQCYERYETID